MAKIKNLFAFDFDDTLAITPSIIGVKRLNSERVADPEFRDWIMDHDLDIHGIEHEDSKKEIIWFTSGDFAKYEKAHMADLEYLEANSLEDQYDFTKTASVDVGGSSPINPMLEILKQASRDSQSRVVIITARSGNQPMRGLSSDSDIIPTNQQDIQSFLSDQGIDLGTSSITTAGDIGAGPQAKVKAMERYIDMYEPKNIFFYDDNLGNVDAIAGMCKEYFPGINIKTFKVDKSGSVSFHKGCS